MAVGHSRTLSMRAYTGAGGTGLLFFMFCFLFSSGGIQVQGPRDYYLCCFVSACTLAVPPGLQFLVRGGCINTSAQGRSTFLDGFEKSAREASAWHGEFQHTLISPPFPPNTYCSLYLLPTAAFFFSALTHKINWRV